LTFTIVEIFVTCSKLVRYVSVNHVSLYGKTKR
jgi:hypothetical protein